MAPRAAAVQAAAAWSVAKAAARAAAAVQAAAAQGVATAAHLAGC